MVILLTDPDQCNIAVRFWLGQLLYSLLHSLNFVMIIVFWLMNCRESVLTLHCMDVQISQPNRPISGSFKRKLQLYILTLCRWPRAQWMGSSSILSWPRYPDLTDCLWAPCNDKWWSNKPEVQYFLLNLFYCNKKNSFKAFNYYTMIRKIKKIVINIINVEIRNPW